MANWLDNVFAMPNGTPGGVGAVDAYGKNVAAAASQGANAMGGAAIAGMNDYMTKYRPYDDKFMGMVDNMGTAGYRTQLRGAAMTGVQQQADAALQTNERRMAAMGLDPNSGAALAMRGQMGLQTALGKAQAATMADRTARDDYMKGLGAINAMGQNVAGIAQKNMTVAGDLSKLGLAGADLGAAAQDRQTNAGANATSAGAAAANASTSAARAANEMTLGMGKLALDRYNIDTSAALRGRELDNSIRTNSLPNQVLSTVAGYGTSWGMDALRNYLRGQTGSVPVEDRVGTPVTQYGYQVPVYENPEY